MHSSTSSIHRLDEAVFRFPVPSNCFKPYPQTAGLSYLLYQTAGPGEAACSWLPIPARLVTSNDIVNGKPDPEPYRKGAELLGIAAADCTVIEDAQPEFARGKRQVRASLRCKHERDAFLRQAGADWIVKDCASVHLADSSRNGDMSLLLSGTA